jgi:hypothetical protein
MREVMTDEVSPQQEVAETSRGAFEMERRLVAARNLYAENRAHQPDSQNWYAVGALLNLQRRIAISAEERYHMIAKEAYFLARQAEFRGPSFVAEWVDAEARIDALLNGNEAEPLQPHPDRTLRGHE